VEFKSDSERRIKRKRKKEKKRQWEYIRNPEACLFVPESRTRSGGVRERIVRLGKLRGCVAMF
jgi:hypothetical protein